MALSEWQRVRARRVWRSHTVTVKLKHAAGETRSRHTVEWPRKDWIVAVTELAPSGEWKWWLQIHEDVRIKPSDSYPGRDVLSLPITLESGATKTEAGARTAAKRAAEKLVSERVKRNPFPKTAELRAQGYEVTL